MRRTTSIVIFAVAGLLFARLSFLVRTGMLTVQDADVLAFFAGHVTHFNTAFFKAITWAGSVWVLVPVAVISGYVLLQHRRGSGAMLLITSLGLAALSGRLLKYLVGRERPETYPALVDTVTGLAFPSVHAAQVTAFCLALFLVLGRAGTGSRAIAGIVLSGIVLCVMLSRLYLQVHYPSDVLGGFLLGVMCASFAAFLVAKNRVG